MEKLKVLFYSQRFPFPMDTGGKIRTGKMLEKLNEVFQITLVTNFEKKKDQEFLSRVTDLCEEYHPVYWEEIEKYSLKFYLTVFSRIFSSLPIAILNDYSANVENTLQELIKEKPFDFIICDFLQPSLNFQHITGIPMILFEHNVEHYIPKRHYENNSNWFLKLFWYSQWKKMEKYEMSACARFDQVIAVSENDEKILKTLSGVDTISSIPTGVDIEYFFPVECKQEEHALVFSGSMDWIPNVDGILFFLKEVLPLIQKTLPLVKLLVVGRNPPEHLLNDIKKYPCVSCVGRVPDVRPYISKHGVYIVPLRIGGGTRIKIYEALAMGKAVVSTTVGAEGLPLKNGEHLILADSPEHFAQAVVDLLQNKSYREKLGNVGMAYIRENFSWNAAAESFADSCHKVMSIQRNATVS